MTLEGNMKCMPVPCIVDGVECEMVGLMMDHDDLSVAISRGHGLMLDLVHPSRVTMSVGLDTAAHRNVDTATKIHLIRALREAVTTACREKNVDHLGQYYLSLSTAKRLAEQWLSAYWR